jgi:hypothetical protein
MPTRWIKTSFSKGMHYLSGNEAESEKDIQMVVWEEGV